MIKVIILLCCSDIFYGDMVNEMTLLHNFTRSGSGDDFLEARRRRVGRHHFMRALTNDNARLAPMDLWDTRLNGDDDDVWDFSRWKHETSASQSVVATMRMSMMMITMRTTTMKVTFEMVWNMRGIKVYNFCTQLSPSFVVVVVGSRFVELLLLILLAACEEVRWVSFVYGAIPWVFSENGAFCSKEDVPKECEKFRVWIMPREMTRMNAISYYVYRATGSFLFQNRAS